MKPSKTQAAEPLLGISMDAASVHSFVLESNFCTRSIPSPSSKIAPPQTYKQPKKEIVFHLTRQMHFFAQIHRDNDNKLL